MDFTIALWASWDWCSASDRDASVGETQGWIFENWKAGFIYNTIPLYNMNTPPMAPQKMDSSPDMSKSSTKPRFHHQGT
jgi:hypothetical protein